MKRPQGFDRPPIPQVDMPRPSRPPVERRGGLSATVPVSPAESAVSGQRNLPESGSPSGSPDISGLGTAEFVTVVPRTAESGTAEPDPSTLLRDATRQRKRYERGEVRRFTKRTRRRKMLWLAALGVAVALVLGVILVSFSPLMALRDIQVEGASRVSSVAVQNALKSQLGKPLPLVNMSAIRSELSSFTLIRSYSTETLPPGTLVIRVVEREPIGVVKNGSKFTVVDPARVVISSSGTRPSGYPLIQVAGPVGSQRELTAFGAAAAVLEALPSSVLTQVDAISASTPDDVTLKLVGSGPSVVWGSASQSDLKAAVLAKLMAVPGNKSVTEYDVSTPSSVVTR